MKKNEKVMSGKGIRSSLFLTVKGKFLAMGIMGIIVALVIGIIGIMSVDQNTKSSDIVALVDDINLKQALNTANDVRYQYYIDNSYINDTLKNLDEMEQSAAKLKKRVSASYSAEVDQILNNVAGNKENYEKLLEFHSSRGYTSDVGKYAEYVDSSEQLRESFGGLVNNNDWVEIEWMIGNTGSGENVTVGGKTYNKVIYSKKLPDVGKRNSLIFRVGGTFTYKSDYYIKNIVLSNGSEEIPVDLAGLELTEKSGDGLDDAGITEFDGQPAIKVTGKYDVQNDRWEEVSTTIPVLDYDMNDYPNLRYELYFDASAQSGQEYKYGGAVSGVYDFSGNLTKLDEMVNSYSQLVVDGSDVASAVNDIQTLMTDIEDNIPKYTTDPSLAKKSSELQSSLRSKLDEMKAIDDQALSIKSDNKAINENLTSVSNKVLSEVKVDMNRVKTLVNIVIIVVILVSVIALALVLIRVIRGINRSVSSFKDAIDKIASGNISVRANAEGSDEFAMFADSLNSFMDILENTVSKIKDMTNVLADSGVVLENSAIKSKEVASNINETIKNISDGAMEQAKDVEISSKQIVEIRSNIDQICESITTLSGKTSEMSSSGIEAKNTMSDLTRSSDSTTEAFTNIAAQVRKTDESVGEIQNAISLIQSVANQINLLSLNASIEAARAGDAGRGFAVVASEISDLADQTNKSAAIIEKIIKMLSAESNKTVETINEVTELIQKQKSDIDSTYGIFSNVSDGIDFTQGAVGTVLNDASQCETASEAVVNLITNLSAISEENAASAETTSNAMEELNAETAKLADTSAKLKQIADNLKEDMDFFNIS